MRDYLTTFEADILRHLNGEPTRETIGWGAAMSEAIGYLQGREWVRRERTGRGIEYKITDAGREALRKSTPVT